MATKSKIEKNRFRTDDEILLEVDDIYRYQKGYFKTEKGKKALQRARKAYDNRNIEKRRKQKRDYMRRKRAEDPDIWRDQ